MAWKCGKHPGKTLADGKACAVKIPTKGNPEAVCGAKGAETPTVFKTGTAAYKAWAAACKAGDTDTIKKLEKVAHAKLESA